VSAVEHFLNVSTSTLEGRRLARKLKSFPEIRQIVRESKDSVSKSKHMAEFFELLG